MKNRLSKLSRHASFMMLLLAASGISTSCKDEYKLDDEMPSSLGTSIYESLEKGGYSYYLRLVSDPDVNPTNARPISEVLSRTGSKTVFVANDEAWEKFFQENAKRAASDPWHGATSYENLSTSQKKLLIHTSMLNNAITMENLSASSEELSSRGDIMRRYTDVELTDTITQLAAEDLPINYNEDLYAEGTDNAGKKSEVDYWARFRGKDNGALHDGILLVTDNTSNMRIHFTQEHMAKNNITDDDFAKFMGRPRKTGDVHIYDALLTEKDAVAQNGYINVTEKLIHPLPNMAEMLRTSGKTNIFSHMLDRWSVPFFNSEVTEAYRDLMAAKGNTEWDDSIFTKRYFANNGYNHKPVMADTKGNYTTVASDNAFRTANSSNLLLKFDPGWNAYAYDDNQWANSPTNAPKFDMAAIFVPNDEALWKYFTQGGGGFPMVETYYLRKGKPDARPYVAPTTLDELYRQIDQIPMDKLYPLINVVMAPSFTSYVPSKMTKFRDDAMEQLFYPEDQQHIVETMLACNGMLYITDQVYGPADYTSVAAPVFTTNTCNVMNFAIYNGSTGGTDYMGLNYYAYLKAMQSRFALFLPSDTAMWYYYDAISFKSKVPRVVRFYNQSGNFTVGADAYQYNTTTGEIGGKYGSNAATANQTEIVNRLKDILESHTLVLDGKDEINTDIDEYYIAKNGCAMKVTRGIINGKPTITQIQGGFQLENVENDIVGSIGSASSVVHEEVRGIQENKVTERYEQKNGFTYMLDSPLIPASRSVYNILSNDGVVDDETYEFNAFYQLADGADNDIIMDCGLVKRSLPASQKNAELKKYSTFIDNNAPDKNVQFFNNYRYTVFVPTADAIEDARALGLATWEDIKADYETLRDPETGKVVLSHTDSIRLQHKILYLTNFIRYHFVDNSVFVDKSQLAASDYVTSSYDNQKGLFCKIYMQRPSADVLQVKDDNGGDWMTVSGKYNVMARDVSCSKTIKNVSDLRGITINSTSYAVIHQIPKVLLHANIPTDWENEAEAKEYLRRFAIR